LVTLIFGMASFAILLQSGSRRLDELLRSGRAWLLLGDASYSIYLIHYPAVSLACKVIRHSSPDLSEPLAFVAVALFAVLCGIALHLLIEAPLLRFFRARMRRPPSDSAPVGIASQP
jgi:peptidoglycan/LPS O-acetylase OafA/YrhL